MKTKRTIQVEIQEMGPDEPQIGDVAWKMLTYADEHGYPITELYRGEFKMCDTGDAETGPMPYIDIGGYVQVTGGCGFPQDIADEVAQYLFYQEQSVV